MKQDTRWSASLFVGVVVCFGVFSRFRLGCYGQTDHAARIEVQHSRQVMPSPLRPDVSDLTAPHLIRRTHSKAAVELVGNIRLLHLRLFIGRRARLFADQPQLSHQMTHLEPAYLNAAFLQHVPDRAAASRLTTMFKDLEHTAALAHAIDIDVITSSSMSEVAGSRHIKHGTDQTHRLMRAELVNQRRRTISSDIKSAVAFFKKAFSRSRRLIFASSSWIFCCSGVSALLCGVTP